MSPYWNVDIIKYKIIEGVKCNPDIILTHAKYSNAHAGRHYAALKESGNRMALGISFLLSTPVV